MRSIVILGSCAGHVAESVDGVNSVATGASANGHNSVLDLAAASSTWAESASGLRDVVVLVVGTLVANLVVGVHGVTTLASAENHSSVGVVATG